MTAPMTSAEVALQLAKLARELDDAVQAIESADLDSTRKRAAFDLAFSHAFLSAAGSVDARKHIATIDTYDERLAADVADTVVRHLRRKIDAVKTRIEVGRSLGAAVRAEIALGGMDGQP